MSRTRTISSEKYLIAPPCNPYLHTGPNKSQTIVNVVKAEGPMTREQVIQRMQELLGPDEASKSKISSLIYQLTLNPDCRRIHYNEDDLLEIMER